MCSALNVRADVGVRSRFCTHCGREGQHARKYGLNAKRDIAQVHRMDAVPCSVTTAAKHVCKSSLLEGKIMILGFCPATVIVLTALFQLALIALSGG
ncbi:MAG: hypothetical protein JWP89_4384 [Schlesneria sp.]|nr:hypothetical protein [Schlesneria sp.]